jgi:serine carboxypeptidase-like clade 1
MCSGDHDMTIPYIGTHEWIESLNLTIKYDWEPWFVDGQVAGLVSIILHPLILFFKIQTNGNLS